MTERTWFWAVVVALAVVVLMFSFGVINALPSPAITTNQGSGAGLTRIYDREAGVVCWKYPGVNTISCLPISQTKLDLGR
jgi:hypothetical protein